MDKKKLRGYILILAVCVLASIVLPKLLDKAADKMVEGIDEETEVSTEKGGTGLSGVLGGFQENESETEPETMTPADENSGDEGRGGSDRASGSEPTDSDMAASELMASVSTQTPSDQMQADGPRTDAEVQEEKEQKDQALQEFRSSFNPTISESFSGLQDVFIGDREEEFRNAIADHIFQAYENLYTVTKIELVEFLDETDDEVRCMVRVYTKSGDKSYSQDYIVAYSKTQDFYSVYAYNR